MARISFGGSSKFVIETCRSRDFKPTQTAWSRIELRVVGCTVALTIGPPSAGVSSSAVVAANRGEECSTKCELGGLETE